MQDFRKIKVWERSHKFALMIYKATSMFPKEEIYGLTSQIRRSCVSIPSNIAEGSSRNNDADYARFLQIAIASASEVDYQLLLSKDLQYLPVDEYQVFCDEINQIRQMLIGLMQTVKYGNAKSSQDLLTA